MLTPATTEPPRTVDSIPDADLVERAVRFAHFERPLGWRWVHVQTALGVGFDTAKNLCVRFGLDPDEEVGAETEAAREGGESDYEDNYEPVLEPVPPATLITDRDTASELRANVRDLERKAADQRDQLTAAGLIIARLVSLLQQPRPHTAPLPYLPNEIPATMQVPVMQLLRAAGLDMHGVPVPV